MTELVTLKLHFIPRRQGSGGPWVQEKCSPPSEAPRSGCSVPGVPLWTATSLEMESGCALSWRGAGSSYTHSYPSHLCWPLQLPLDLSPGPFDLIPSRTTGSSTLRQHDYLWKVTSPSNFTQKGFQGCRDLQLRGILFLLKRRREPGEGWDGGGYGGVEKTNQGTKIDFALKSPGCCWRNPSCQHISPVTSIYSFTNSADHPILQTASVSSLTSLSLSFFTCAIQCQLPRAAARITEVMYAASTVTGVSFPKHLEWLKRRTSQECLLQLESWSQTYTLFQRATKMSLDTRELLGADNVLYHHLGAPWTSVSSLWKAVTSLWQENFSVCWLHFNL